VWQTNACMQSLTPFFKQLHYNLFPINIANRDQKNSGLNARLRWHTVGLVL